MLDSFSGKLRLHDGTVVDAVLTIADDTLTVSAESMEVGTWPMKYCRVSRRSETEFELSIDGERTMFHPIDPYAFGKVAADRFHGSSIADRINVIRSMPVARDAESAVPYVAPSDESTPRSGQMVSMDRIPWAVAGAIAAAAALIVVGGLALTGGIRTDETVQETTTSTAAAAPSPDLFMLTPDGFRERWNAAVVDLAPRFVIGGRFGTGRFEEALSDRVLLTGAVDGDGTIATIKLSIHPTTSPDETEFALASMGIAMSVADPTLTELDRTRLIRRLGLEGFPTQLSLDDIDGEVTENGIRYWLLFIDLEGTETDLLSFGVAEAE